MIFPSAAVERARRELAEQLDAAAIPPESAFARLLALEPHDRTALFEMSRLRQQAGDLQGAEDFCRRGLASHPCDYRFYVQLSGLLAEGGRDLALAGGLMELGLLKLLGDPDSREDAERLRRKGRFQSCAGFEDPVALEALVSEIAARREHEPLAVTDELRPLRLIADLQECFGNELERTLVDEFLRHGRACAPLLIGVLRGFADDYLSEGGQLMAEAAMALLGEIGDPGSLAPLVEFAVLEDKALSDIASWALLRIAELKPADTVGAFAAFDRGCSGAQRACIADALAAMPEAPGKREVLLALLENFQAVREAERADTFLVIATGLLSVLGKAAPSLIRDALEKNGRVLPIETRGSALDLLKAYASDPSLFAILPDEPVPNVYDICCADRLAAYAEDEDSAGSDQDETEEEHEGAALHAGPSGMPGRNDPCWCGSGRKYKRCHLAADKNGSLGNLPTA